MQIMKKILMFSILMGMSTVCHICADPITLLPEPIDDRLKKLSFGNTQIKLTSVSNPAITETHNLKREEYGITLSTAHLSKGTYLVSLLQDGSVADTKKVVHE